MGAPVSAVIIAYNEESKLRECIEPLDWCDEIIVVDNQSTDATREIAEELADKVLVRAVPEDKESFEILRQFGIEEANNDWILRVDADEIVPDSLAEELTRIIEEDVADVINVPRKNMFVGSWYEYSWPDYTPTLWKRGSVKITDELHRGMVPVEGSRVLDLDPIEENGLIHYTHSSYAGFLQKSWHYTKLEAQQASPSFRKLVLEPGYHFLDLFIIRRVWIDNPKNIFPALGRILTPPIVCLRSLVNKVLN